MFLHINYAMHAPTVQTNLLRIHPLCTIAVQTHCVTVNQPLTMYTPTMPSLTGAHQLYKITLQRLYSVYKRLVDLVTFLQLFIQLDNFLQDKWFRGLQIICSAESFSSLNKSIFINENFTEFFYFKNVHIIQVFNSVVILNKYSFFRSIYSL